MCIDRKNAKLKNDREESQKRANIYERSQANRPPRRSLWHLKNFQQIEHIRVVGKLRGAYKFLREKTSIPFFRSTSLLLLHRQQQKS
jgi:hypothetical protein